MNRVVVSAPGKLLLFGEHAVVYGYPSIVTAVDRRINVEAVKIEGKLDHYNCPGVKDLSFIQGTVKQLKKVYKISQKVAIATNSSFSQNYGLGSSSAVTVATVGALSQLFKLKMSKREIFDLSYKIILSLQGVGSGFDAASAVFGKTLYYVYAGKVIESIKVKSLSLVIGYSGIKADTKTIVKKLGQRYKQNRIEIEEKFIKIAKIVEKARKALINNNYNELGLLMNQNHKLLKELGVSSDRLDTMIEDALKAGASGAKLSGAGGGDCMIALVSEEKKKLVSEAVSKAGGTVIKVNPNAQGVRIES